MRFEVNGSRRVIGLLSRGKAVSERRNHKTVRAPICAVGNFSHLYLLIYDPQAQRPQALG